MTQRKRLRNDVPPMARRRPDTDNHPPRGSARASVRPLAARVRSFPPIGRTTAHTLILGTMPGVASLAAGQYYGHPRNAFWPIVGELFGFDPTGDYATRVRSLADSQIAVWDVLASCERAGSLDSRIDPDSVVPNDFARFFAVHRHIERICFNGGNAETLFRKHVLPSLESVAAELVRLPSTSPANASVSRERKLHAWRIALAPHDSLGPPALHNAASVAVP